MNGPRKPRDWYRAVAGVLATAFVLSVALFTGAEIARAVTSPPTDVNECYAYQYVFDQGGDGDILVICRGELPVGTVPAASPEQWCAYLNNTSGCTTDPIDPDEPTSLIPDRAYFRIYTGSSPVLRHVSDLPRVEHSLSGHWFDAGHGFTIGDTTFQACYAANETFFTTSADETCIPITWRTPGTLAAARDQLESDLISVMKNLENEYNFASGTLVDAELITDTGRTYAREAFPFITDAAPDAFRNSSTTAGSVVESFATSEVGGLQERVNATATQTDVYEAGDRISKDFTGLDIGKTGGFMGMLIGLVGGWGAKKFHNRNDVAMISASSGLLSGIWVFVPLMIFYGMLAIAGTFTAAYVAFRILR